MEKSITKTFRQYEAGRDYKRRIGLYETVRRNERFYRGEQWSGNSPDLPQPVFNVVRRIIDYLVCAVVSGSVSVSYTDDSMPFIDGENTKQLIRAGVDTLTKNASYRWEREKMDEVMYKLMLDAAISGDGILYCYWDPTIKTGQPYSGDIVTEIIDNTNLFVADVNSRDLQKQEYIILSGRETVNSLRAEAIRYGVPEVDAMKIVSDSDNLSDANGLSYAELNDPDSHKATYLIKFWRQDGIVWFEKSTKNCVIRRASTGMKKYPVCYFNWYPTKNSFHGTSPVSGMIANQKFINTAYAMVMKHMTDTAFSKVIYDKTKIPEWSNEVGEAIAAVGGGNIADAVSVVGVGEMQDGYLELIKNAISNTKEMNGATETALGNVTPTNTSAIIAMQNAAKIPLIQVRTAFCRCIEELAAIWAEMILCYYPTERQIPYYDNGVMYAANANLGVLKNALICSHVEVGTVERSSSLSTIGILDKMLSGGHIDAKTYVEMLPEGALQNRSKLIEGILSKKGINVYE